MGSPVAASSRKIKGSVGLALCDPFGLAEPHVLVNSMRLSQIAQKHRLFLFLANGFEVVLDIVAAPRQVTGTFPPQFLWGISSKMLVDTSYLFSTHFFFFVTFFKGTRHG